MVTGDGASESDPRTTKPEESPSLISLRHLVAACVLGAFSLIDEWRITEGLRVSGGVTFVALAAVVLLWPVVRQVAARGGEIDLKGLRLKVNEIKDEAQRIESDNALRIQELESEIDSLRPRSSVPDQESDQIESSVGADSVSVLAWAIAAYKAAAPLWEARKRVEIDKEIIRRGRKLSLRAMRDFLDSESWGAEAQMAVAVALGLPPSVEEEDGRARLLVELVDSSHERVRARAGTAAKRWGERHATGKKSRLILLRSIEHRLLVESLESGARRFLERAQEVLSATQEWGGN